MSSIGTGSGTTPKNVSFGPSIPSTPSIGTVPTYAQGANATNAANAIAGQQPIGYTASGQLIYGLMPPVQQYSKAAEFDKGGKRSPLDYDKFTNREGWARWQRSLLGTALNHNCEKVLDPNYVPDPSDADEVALFVLQNKFMYAVFTRVITEPSAVNILQNYSNPDRAHFGDAQQAYANMCDHFSSEAMAQVTIPGIETKLTTMRLDKHWNKLVTVFVNQVSQLIKDHMELTRRTHADSYYIEKLKATFEEHNNMSQHLATIDTQDASI